MPFPRQTILVAVASCAATFAFVATVNVSCGTVRVPTACADQCPDLTALQDRIAALEAKAAAQQPVVFLARLPADQSVASGTDTTVALTADVDTHHAFNGNHEYVIPLSGKYLITATISSSGMDKARANNEIWITRANTPPVRQNAVTAPGNSSGIGAIGLRINSATIVQLDQGDRVALKTFHDYPGVRFVVSDAATPGLVETNLQIIRIPDIN
jgi:hypothetical protein